MKTKMSKLSLIIDGFAKTSFMGFAYLFAILVSLGMCANPANASFDNKDEANELYNKISTISHKNFDDEQKFLQEMSSLVQNSNNPEAMQEWAEDIYSLEKNTIESLTASNRKYTPEEKQAIEDTIDATIERHKKENDGKPGRTPEQNAELENLIYQFYGSEEQNKIYEYYFSEKENIINKYPSDV